MTPPAGGELRRSPAAALAVRCAIAEALHHSTRACVSRGLSWPAAARAQARSQLWANGIIDWLASDRLSANLDVEGQTNPGLIKATPHVDYAVVPWADVLAEVQFERETGSDTTTTPRFGAQFHILSRLLHAHADAGANREKLPRRRLAVSSLLRAENSSSAWRLRDRFDAAYPLNRHKTTDDGASTTSDAELFVPFDRAPGGDLVNQVRIRSGIGYRKDFAWRFDVLYIWDGTRHADAGPLTPKFHAIDIRVLRQF